MNSFKDKFRIDIDTSDCKSIIAGFDVKLNDTWYYRDLTFESGKIYGIVSEYQQGCEYLSYLLGGRVAFENVKMYCNGNPICQNDLADVSWNMEPNGECYGKKIVRKSIESSLQKSDIGMEYETISEKFRLTPERFDRKYIHLSGERWRAACAYGYAQGKKIFFAPYEPSRFYYCMCSSSLLIALRALTSSGALVILPTGSDDFIKHIADEVVYLNRDYDIESLKDFYSEQSGENWIK